MFEKKNAYIPIAEARGFTLDNDKEVAYEDVIAALGKVVDSEIFVF